MLHSTRLLPLFAGIALLSASLAGVAMAAPQDAAARDGQSGMASGKRNTMADMDTDHDGRLSRREFAAAHGGKLDEFAAHDGNGDGFISQAEMDATHAAMQPAHEAAHSVQQAADKPRGAGKQPQ